MIERVTTETRMFGGKVRLPNTNVFWPFNQYIIPFTATVQVYTPGLSARTIFIFSDSLLPQCYSQSLNNESYNQPSLTSLVGVS